MKNRCRLPDLLLPLPPATREVPLLSPLPPSIDFPQGKSMKEALGEAYMVGEHGDSSVAIWSSISMELKVVAKIYWGVAREKLCEPVDEQRIDTIVMGSGGLGTIHG